MANLEVFRYLHRATLTLDYQLKEGNMLLVAAYNNLFSKLANKGNTF